MVSLSFGYGPDRDTGIMMDCDLEGLQDTRHPLDQLISGKIDLSHFFLPEMGRLRYSAGWRKRRRRCSSRQDFERA